MDNYSKDVLSEIQERAFSEGYNQALIEKMYAEEGAKEKEAILDRLKRYGGKVKDLAWGDKWEGNKLRRGVTIGTGAAAAAGLGTLAYLKHKKAKAEAAAEALEEAAEAQREYSAILAERIYSEEEDALEEAADIVENASPADKKRLAIAGAIGAGSVAGGVGATYGVSKRNAKKLREVLGGPLTRGERDAVYDKLHKNLAEKVEEDLPKLWKSGKAGKAKVIGAGTGALALGAGAGVGAKKAYDYYKSKKNND